MLTDTDYLEIAERNFSANTKDHTLTIIRDDGVYRHLLCGKPGTGIWSWAVITWPAHLAVSGDLGSFIFRRQGDMLNFFTGPVNPGYWLEKCTAWDRGSSPRGVVSLGKIRDRLGRPFDHEDLEYLDGSSEVSAAIEILVNDLNEPDAWDWDITDYDWAALRILHAISWTVKQYSEHVRES